MKELLPYIRHTQICYANDQNDPLAKHCNCGLKEVWMKIWFDKYNQNPYVEKIVTGM